MPTRIITNREIYEIVIQEMIVEARSFVWIATADLKDLYVEKRRNRVPFLEILSDLIGEGIGVRLLHAKEPGPIFRQDFDQYPNLINGLERMLCPRVHFKNVIVDGKQIYTGSANLTGAGMGAKSEHKRNFETGVVSNEKDIITPVMNQFDEVWIGKNCRSCGRKMYCNDSPFD